jgi:hypothetical protein
MATDTMKRTLSDAYNERRRIIAEAKEHGIILG